MDTTVFRTALVNLLTRDEAHAGTSRSLEGLTVANRHRRAPGLPHSVWELLEHLRLAQEDILRYTLDPSWKSPEWPTGYWPDPDRTPIEAEWKRSVAAWRKDLDEVVALVNDPQRDLTAQIPHGEGRTYLRQVLLIADHAAYHTAQIIDVRRALGNWKD
jgi:hypothetical protein